MGGKAVSQSVGMDAFRDASSLGGSTTRMPNGFCVDRLITAMILCAWKEPDAGFLRQPLPVLAQFVEQLRTEHYVAIFAPLAASDVNHHALAVDVGDLQMRQFGTAHASGV